MVKSLRKRPRPDDLENQQRKISNANGRIVYLGLLGIFTIAVGNFLFGDFVFLRADGLIVRDKISITPDYIARIEAVNVKAGQSISEGDIILKLQSSEMLERFAELSASKARLAAQTVSFKVRSKTVLNLLPLAVKRENETNRILKSYDALSDRRLVTTSQYDQALRARYVARQDYVKLSAENTALSDEISTLDAARSDAARALDDLRAHYAKGSVKASVSGSIGAIVPSVGDVYRPGQTILSLYTGTPYVLAYLPRRYLFAIDVGDRVKVSNGRQSIFGEIERILPVTGSTPKEFQNTFKPRSRNQLARIRFDAPISFPLHEKVTITSDRFGF